ncbi:MAG TPA: ATP-binding protein [Candidatus Saccharimonadales bacterium]
MDNLASLLNLSTLPALAVLLTTIVVMLGFGLIVFTRTSHKAYGWYFAITMLGIGAWAIGDMMLLLARDQTLLQVGAQLFYIAPLFIPVSIWFFAISFPENRSIGFWPPVIAGTAIATFTLGFLFNFDFFIKDIIISDRLNVPVPAMPGFFIYASFFSFFFILTYIAFLRRMRQNRGITRIQVAYTFYGALVASIPALFTNLSLPIMGNASLIWLGPLSTLSFAVAVTLAIVKHRLFDIRSYAVRSAAYLLTLFVAGVVYVIPVVVLSSSLLGTSLSTKNVTILALITLVVAFLFQPLKRFFDRITRKWFYQDAYDPQEFFNAFNQSLVETIDLNRLLGTATDLISQTMKAEYCLVALGQEGSKMPRIIGTQEVNFDSKDVRRASKLLANNRTKIIVADYLLPDNDLKALMVKNSTAILAHLVGPRQELGYIILGPKKSGNAYTSQDIRVLDTVANELTIAIQNALRFEEIQEFNITLRQRIDDATRKLRHTNDKLRQLDQTKDDFISMASHQLRTPLTSVKGYVSMVLEGDAGKVTPLQRKLLNQSFVSAQRMVYLISDLLNVSRLRTGKFVIEPVPSNLAKVIKDEIEQLQETAKGRGLELSYNKPERFPTLMLDETKIRQVIMNFIDNAIYYTPSGGHITVALNDKPSAVEFTVTDDGIGVPKHEQHHLFTKFFRAHNARRARPDGTGLGLFMAKKVVVAQGGAIIFKSKEGQGSTFGFSFGKDKLQPLPPDAE